MNADERKLCHIQYGLCAGVISKAIKAELKTDSLAAAHGVPAAWNNIYDAYRHAYWQAMVRRHFGPLVAIAWDYAHESTSTDRTQVCMDQHNNFVGRSIGSNNPTATDDQLWQKVISSTDLEPAPFSC